MKKNIIFDIKGVLFEKSHGTTHHFNKIDAGHKLVHLAQGHTLFVLSNMSTATWHALQQEYPSFFKNFEDTIISDHAGCKKPDPRIFTFLLQKHQLDPQQCVFIDDNYENVEVAQQLGITGLWCNDFEHVYKSLGTLLNR